MPIDKRKNWIIIILELISIIFIMGVLFYFKNLKNDSFVAKEIANFQECIEAGNPAMENYPRQCRDRKGNKTFTENIGNEPEKIDLIRLNTPRPNQEISSPLVIEGEARGIWYFEGDFPIILTDWDGKIIAEGYATAKGEWMDEGFVPFKGELVFENPTYSNHGSLILKKDNPSDLPEHDDALEIPILFKEID